MGPPYPCLWIWIAPKISLETNHHFATGDGCGGLNGSGFVIGGSYMHEKFEEVKRTVANLERLLDGVLSDRVEAVKEGWPETREKSVES